MRVIALLGRRDEPTDGVADYCNSLARALLRQTIVSERAKACVPSLRLEIFGRGAEEATLLLEGLLQKLGIEYRLRGVVPAEETIQTLESVDVLLCVRGNMSTRLGSGIAAIACGIPILGFGRRGQYAELDAAGVVLVPWGSREKLAEAMTRVLTDAALWQELHEKNRRAQSDYFSRDVIAGSYAAILREPDAQLK